MLIRPLAPSWALTLTLLVPAAAWCADDPLTVVQVAGARYDQRREETAASVVVGREELLRHGDRSLADALKRVAGVTIGGAGGRGTDIRLRGLGDGYTQVLLDGVAAPNGFSLESLAPELIERVEIVRTASAELGTQSIAGTVNIVLRKAAAPARTEVKLGLDRQRGAYSSSLSAEAGAKGSGYSYAVPVTLARTRVGTLQLADETGPDLHRTARQDEMNAATTLAISPRASLVLANGDKVDLRGLVNASRRAIDMTATERVLAGSGTRYPERGALFTTSAIWLRADAGWTRQFEQGARIEVKAGAETTDRNSDFEFAALRGGRARGHRAFRTRRFRRACASRRGDLHRARRAPATLSRPGSTAHARAAARSGSDAISMCRAWRRRCATNAFAARSTVSACSSRMRGTSIRRWSLSAGWRGEVLTTSVIDAAAPAIERRNVIGSPLLQALYKAGGGVQWRAGLARTYKAPTMFKLIPRRFVTDNNNSATNPDTEGNPGLRPEKAWGLDIGYDHYFGKDSLFSGQRLRAPHRRRDGQRLSWTGRAGWRRRITRAGRWRAAWRWKRSSRCRRCRASPSAPTWRATGRAWNASPAPDNRLDEQAPLSANAGIEYRGTITRRRHTDLRARRAGAYCPTPGPRSTGPRARSISTRCGAPAKACGCAWRPPTCWRRKAFGRALPGQRWPAPDTAQALDRSRAAPDARVRSVVATVLAL